GGLRGAAVRRDAGWRRGRRPDVPADRDDHHRSSRGNAQLDRPGRGHGPRSLPGGLRARTAQPFPGGAVVPDAGDPRGGGGGPRRGLQPAHPGQPVPGGGRGGPALGDHVPGGGDERATDRDLTTRAGRGRNWSAPGGRRAVDSAALTLLLWETRG